MRLPRVNAGRPPVIAAGGREKSLVAQAPIKDASGAKLEKPKVALNDKPVKGRSNPGPLVQVFQFWDGGRACAANPR
ncbi:MAG: hypothetical protein ACR2JB_07875 [Bryobacteraceae bacterium]